MDLPPRRSALKEATWSAHMALDALVGSFGTAADYRCYLAGIAAFRLPVEAWLSKNSLPPAFSDWQPGFVRDELKADLADLDTPEPPDGRPFSPPEGEGVVGLLYVLEGSSLGARLLAKRAEALGFSAEFGARHLFSQARNFSNWRAFSERMEIVRGYDARAAAHWANTAFDYARDAFESALNADHAVRRPDQL
ncbi:MAG: biliverdin-producing heme oxygenase [Rhizobium rhizophilum]